MIALTDIAVKNMLESRFRIPAIFSATDDSTSLVERGDIRFQMPSSLLNQNGEIDPKVKFPFCTWMRETGSIDAERFNIAQARDGVSIGFDTEDRTKSRFLRIIPIKYPYAVKYYVANVSQAIRLEKKYWGLTVDFDLNVEFPPNSDERLKTINIKIVSLNGFDPPKTDQIYSKGRYYTGSMNFTVKSWIIEGIDIPLVQKSIIRTYDGTGTVEFTSSVYDERYWNRNVN